MHTEWTNNMHFDSEQLICTAVHACKSEEIVTVRHLTFPEWQQNFYGIVWLSYDLHWCKHTHTHTCACGTTNAHRYTHVHIHTCTHTLHTYVVIYTHMYMYAHIHITHLYTHAYMDVDIRWRPVQTCKITFVCITMCPLVIALPHNVRYILATSTQPYLLADIVYNSLDIFCWG